MLKMKPNLITAAIISWHSHPFFICRTFCLGFSPSHSVTGKVGVTSVICWDRYYKSLFVRIISLIEAAIISPKRSVAPEQVQYLTTIWKFVYFLFMQPSLNSIVVMACCHQQRLKSAENSRAMNCNCLSVYSGKDGSSYCTINTLLQLRDYWWQAQRKQYKVWWQILEVVITESERLIHKIWQEEAGLRDAAV